jgi:hypothetical protein
MNLHAVQAGVQLAAHRGEVMVRLRAGRQMQNRRRLGRSVATRPIGEASPPPVFRADHPFAFAIRDVRTGVVLFLGRFVAP